MTITYSAMSVFFRFGNRLSKKFDFNISSYFYTVLYLYTKRILTSTLTEQNYVTARLIDIIATLLTSH